MNYEEEILTDLMLGDGFLEKRKTAKNASLKICRKLTDKIYQEWIQKRLLKFNPKLKEYSIFDKRTNKNYYSIRLTTSVHLELTILWNKWYKNYIKIIPNDLKLTPLIFAIWFFDDGCVTIQKRKYDIKLATHGFSYLETKFLQYCLKRDLNLNFKIYNEYNKNKSKIHSTLRLTNKSDVYSAIKILDQFAEILPRKSIKWQNNINLLIPKLYPNCKFCFSTLTYKNGTNKGIQKYLCKSCKKQFYLK